MKQTYLDIQQEVIRKYKIVIVEHSTCRGRMHAHCDGTRRVCKWQPKNSLKTTCDLFHEIGHIMTKTSKMRRCESEYYATIWAFEELKKYGLKPTEKYVDDYQDYIDMEKARGLRRNGSYYGEFDLRNYKTSEIKELPVKEPKPVRRLL